MPAPRGAVPPASARPKPLATLRGFHSPQAGRQVQHSRPGVQRDGHRPAATRLHWMFAVRAVLILTCLWWLLAGASAQAMTAPLEATQAITQARVSHDNGATWAAISLPDHWA